MYSRYEMLPGGKGRLAALRPATAVSVQSVQSVKSVTHLHLRDHLDHLPAGTGQTHDHLALCHEHLDHLAPVQRCRRRHPPRYPAPLSQVSTLSLVSQVSPFSIYVAMLAIFRPVLGKRVATLLATLAPLATLPPLAPPPPALLGGANRLSDHRPSNAGPLT
jgi:hypothetical protein